MEEFRPEFYAGSLLLVTGLFLVADALYLHLITFSYAAVGLAWLDPYISHAYWGALFVILGLMTALNSVRGSSR